MLKEWGNPDDEAIDGFTFDEIEHMSLDSVVTAKCSECGGEVEVEPDADKYDCHECGAKGSVTSPLRKLGLV